MSSLAYRCLPVIAFLAFMFPVLCPCQSTAQKKLQVVILAVSSYDDHHWDNPRLQLAIEERVKELKDYFSEHFPKADVHIVSTHNETTHESILTFLRGKDKGQFHQFANGTVTLLFILSHGVPKKSPNPNFSQDLSIVTSDTTKRGTRALSFVKDVFPEFGGLEEKGSIVIAFLDTCYSGAASSLTMEAVRAGAENYGLRTMIMASSLSDQKSYLAAFTKALLTLWETSSPDQSCTDPDQAPEVLHKTIDGLLGAGQLGPTEGEPKVIVQYKGKLCLESFSADQGIVVFYNAMPRTVAAIIKENGRQIDLPVPLQTEVVRPYKVARRKYSISIVRNDSTPLSKHDTEIDLAVNPVTFETVGAPKTERLGATYLRISDYIKLAGLPEDLAQAYQMRAYASFISMDDHKSASRVAASLKSNTALADETWKGAFTLAVENKHEPKGYWPGWKFGPDEPPSQSATEKQLESEFGISELARLEKLAGRFGRAARYYKKAAAKYDTTDALSRKLALQAYFAFGAWVEPDEAQKIRNKYELSLAGICPDCVEAEQAAIREQSPDAYERFESLCTVRLLAHLDY